MLQEKSSLTQKEPEKLAKLQKVEVMYLKCVPFNPSNLKSFQVYAIEQSNPFIKRNLDVPEEEEG